MRAGVGSGPPLGKSVASAGLNAGEVCLEEVASELGFLVGTFRGDDLSSLGFRVIRPESLRGADEGEQGIDAGGDSPEDHFLGALGWIYGCTPTPPQTLDGARWSPRGEVSIRVGSHCCSGVYLARPLGCRDCAASTVPAGFCSQWACRLPLWSHCSHSRREGRQEARGLTDARRARETHTVLSRSA